MSARLSDQRCLMPKTLTPSCRTCPTHRLALRAPRLHWLAAAQVSRLGLATCSTSWSRLVTLGGIPDQRRQPRRRKLSSDRGNDFRGRTRSPGLGCGQSFPQRTHPPAGRQRSLAHEWRLSRLAALIVVSPWVSISHPAVFDTPAFPLARSSCPTLALARHCASGEGR
jgi:hypothetical protein